MEAAGSSADTRDLLLSPKRTTFADTDTRELYYSGPKRRAFIDADILEVLLSHEADLDQLHRLSAKVSHLVADVHPITCTSWSC